MTRYVRVSTNGVPRSVKPPTSAASAAGEDSDAIHDNVAGEIAAITAKGSPTTSDFLLIEDAAASNVKKRITIGDLPGGVSDHGALTGLADDDHTQYLLAAGTRAATYLEVSGLTGATASSPRFVGGTLSGAPASGTFALGDYIVTEDGNIYVCTTAGTPGTWTAVGAGAATDSDAIHDNVANEISAITEKTTPVSGDLLVIEDSAASYVKKRVQIGNLPAGGGGKSYVTEPGMRPPDSAGTGDVEFQSQSNGTNPAASLFSWGNQGSATAAINNGFLVMNSATTTGLRALLKATPGAGNFQVDTMMQAHQFEATHWAGLVMLWGTPGTPTAIRAMGRYYNTAITPRARFVYTTYNTSYAATSDDAFTNLYIAAEKVYMRVEWDGTNLIYKFSPNGLVGTYFQMTSQAEGLGRPDYVGLGVNNNGATNASIAAFSFLRFGWTADFDPTTDD